MTPSTPAVPAHSSVQPIPFKRDSGSTGAALADGAVGVLLISLLAIAAVLVIRKKLGLRLLPSAKPGMLKVLETQRLGPKALLSVVEFGDTHYLIAQGEQGISCVASVPASQPAGAAS
jgi:flagellar biogenesis protein FliO